MERSEIEQALANSEFFKYLDKKEIEKVSRLCVGAEYGVGDVVFQQGDFGEHLYVILEGYIFLERSTDLGVRKGRVVIDALGRGRVLGCWSTLLNEPHHLMSSAVCQKPTRLAIVKGDVLRALMVENKEFGFYLLERLCHLLRNRIQAAYGAMEKI